MVNFKHQEPLSFCDKYFKNKSLNEVCLLANNNNNNNNQHLIFRANEELYNRMAPVIKEIVIILYSSYGKYCDITYFYKKVYVLMEFCKVNYSISKGNFINFFRYCFKRMYDVVLKKEINNIVNEEKRKVRFDENILVLADNDYSDSKVNKQNCFYKVNSDNLNEEKINSSLVCTSSMDVQTNIDNKRMLTLVYYKFGKLALDVFLQHLENKNAVEISKQTKLTPYKVRVMLEDIKEFLKQYI